MGTKASPEETLMMVEWGCFFSWGRSAAVSRIGQIFDPHNTGVVDEDVERRILLGHLGSESANVSGVFDVEYGRSHARVLGSSFIERLLATAGDDDLVPERVKSFCQTASNARTAAGDQDCVAGNFHAC
jgi:hypothetical protein